MHYVDYYVHKTDNHENNMKPLIVCDVLDLL